MCARARLDVMAFDEERFRREVRWSKMSIVMQAAMNALNPVLRVADRVIEPLLVHQGLQREAALARVHDVFQMVGVPLDFTGRYAFELSGGMRPGVVLAMALVLNPTRATGRAHVGAGRSDAGEHHERSQTDQARSGHEALS